MMARTFRRWNSDGNLEVVHDDGRIELWNTSTGELLRESAPNPRLAAAMVAGDTNAMEESIAYGTEWLNSPLGQDYLGTRRATADEERRRWDAEFGLREGDSDLRRSQLGLQRDELGLRRDELGLRRQETEARIRDLERQYGLQQSRLGLEWTGQDIQYKKTPRSWIDALDWERGGRQAGVPIYLQRLAENVGNPAFAAKGPGPGPEMNSMTNVVARMSGQPVPAGAAASGGATDTAPVSGTPASQDERTRQLQAIIKASPPSGEPGMTSRDAASIELLKEIYRQGANKVKEGVLETFDPDEIGTMQAVWDRESPGGGDRFLRDYGRSRIPRNFNPYTS